MIFEHGGALQKAKSAEQREQLSKLRHKVDFDTYDVTVDELLRRVQRKRIDIAPVYQRQFQWDTKRQSRLIESVLLGIPVPPLFMATNVTSENGSSWEVVDGLQRLLTLVNFVGEDRTRKVAKLVTARLKLASLDKLNTFEGAQFSDLPNDIQNALEDRPMKVIVLNDKSDLEVRFDLFERLNTGGVELSDHEIRECVYRGDFIDLLNELIEYPAFRKVVVLPDNKWKDGTPQDFALRFFAFLDRYETFEHSVRDFLNDYIKDAHKDPQTNLRSNVFKKTFDYLALCFPVGLKTRKGQTPVNLFEGVAVGAALALQEVFQLNAPSGLDWVNSSELKSFTTGATNSKKRVVGRVEYCKRRFLGVDDD